jgi:hypothetical protein
MDDSGYEHLLHAVIKLVGKARGLSQKSYSYGGNWRGTFPENEKQILFSIVSSHLFVRVRN